MAETNVFERTFERTLCDGTYQVSGIHQNTSCFVFCTTTRPKLLINDCGKRNKETAISYCPFLFSIVCSWYAFMLEFQDTSVLIITDLYLSASTISYNSSVNTIKCNKETATNIYKDSNDKKIALPFNSTS